MGTQRKALSKRLRFDVFKRDRFACQYCGATAPDVLLHVDHIDPVKRGGKNDITNLITACASCNGGKGAEPLDENSALAKSRRQLEELEERRTQLRLMMDWRRGLEDLKEQSVRELGAFWSQVCPGYSLNEHGLAKLRKHMMKYSPDELMSAMSEACTHYLRREANGTPEARSVQVAFDKIPSMAWVQQQRRVEPDIDRLFYIRGILRSRLNGYEGRYDHEFMPALRRLRDAGHTLDDIATAAKTVSGIAEFRAWVNSWAVEH